MSLKQDQPYCKDLKKHLEITIIKISSSQNTSLVDCRQMMLTNKHQKLSV